MPEWTVAVVDDEPDLREAVRRHLEEEGFRVVEVPNGRELLQTLPKIAPDLIVLDIMMPEMDGLAVLRELAKSPYVPVLMLTARNEEEEKVAALELGADDYLTKPYHSRELVARVRAILRRKSLIEEAKSRPAAPHAVGSLSIDLQGNRVWLAGEPVRLTATEFSLLRFFVSHPGRVLSRQELLDEIWEKDFEGEPHTVDVHVANLRKKLASPDQPTPFIRTVWGVGYSWEG